MHELLFALLSGLVMLVCDPTAPKHPAPAKPSPQATQPAAPAATPPAAQPTKE